MNRPFGWRFSVEPGYLEPDPDEQLVVRRAVQLRHAGQTLQAIADALHFAGYRNRAGGRILPRMVWGILRRHAEYEKVRS